MANINLLLKSAEESLSRYSLSFSERETVLNNLQEVTQVVGIRFFLARNSACQLLARYNGCYLYTQADRIDSQGLQVSSDGSYALSHQSTIPSNYYRNKYGNLDSAFIEQFRVPSGVLTLENLNMDRGWVGRLGSMVAACVADGVSGNGIRSMHVAQMCMNSVFQYFMIHGPCRFQSSNGVTAESGIRVFQEVQNVVSDDEDYLMGATTCAFAGITQKEGEGSFVEGAAIGDSAVIHVDVERGIATRLNLIAREEGKRSNTGGQIVGGSRELNDQAVVGFSVQVDPKDLVILASDGLVDNLISTAAIPRIVSNPIFAKVPTPVWMENSLPSLECLDSITAQKDPLVSITASVATERLNNYVRWVTFNRAAIEQAWYAEHNAEERFPVEYKEMCAKTDDVIIIAIKV